MQTKSNRVLMLIIGLSLYAILWFIFGIAWGCDLLLQPQETEYYSTIESMETYALAMENADKAMLSHFSCPHLDANGLWCKIWRNNH